MFEKLKGSFDKGVAAVSVKSESIVETSRVRMAISNAQKERDAAVSALGARLYESWAAGSVDMDGLEEDCKKIQEIQQGMDELKDRLEQIKEEETRILGAQKKPAETGGAVFCTNCGKKLEAGTRFCDECGTPVKG